MRVGVNTLFMRYPTSGMGQYVLGLMKSLRRFGDRLSCVPLAPTWDRTDTSVRPAKSMRDALWELWGLRVASRAQKVDLLHCPYWASPLAPGVPTVVTIPDVAPLLPMPEFKAYTRSMRSKVYYRLVSVAARRADAVITLSEAAAADISGLLKIPRPKIQVIPMAADLRFRRIEDPRASALLRERYGVAANYILFVASGFDARKNVIGLIRAFAQLKRLYDGPIQLVIASELSNLRFKACPDPRPLLEALELKNDVDVRFPGFIQSRDMPALYSAAIMFVHPSLYEGFGLTLVEAMTCGVPCIVCNSGALPEVAGSGGLVVDARVPEDLAGAMLNVLSDEEMRESLALQAARRARQFSWEQTALKTWEVYQKIAGI